MNKNRVKKIEAEILPSLSDRERLKLILKANAAGDQEAAERFINTIPQAVLSNFQS